ncbi:unnamed protein product [Protopolystoma xenopodis]|uniref:Uncharacterized protein n=1 Tax=Protopolystoma xenopodis TaxID=117903 RepID=A0A3S5AHQ6_9PLAT|nr:unnamed protein product [Protopolystoma xenopodis]
MKGGLGDLRVWGSTVVTRASKTFCAGHSVQLKRGLTPGRPNRPRVQATRLRRARQRYGVQGTRHEAVEGDAGTAGQASRRVARDAADPLTYYSRPPRRLGSAAWQTFFGFLPVNMAPSGAHLAGLCIHTISSNNQPLCLYQNCLSCRRMDGRLLTVDKSTKAV